METVECPSYTNLKDLIRLNASKQSSIGASLQLESS